ncbi:hypothetical protein N7478_010645 [Penicillium angulare]|uniref:uncharacterized protein n=1 Tax=Penicillium angulare TaxID=116970 RepID=UPI0025421B5B|nr:uncharacterized protein N7478_010645 [Penicillium angulare]KAJ5267837.1 hypothetical protein N7478_010645 [Penicillium angulare]
MRYQEDPQETAAKPSDSAGDSCEIKRLRRRQLRNQAPPQGHLRNQGPLAMCKHLCVVLGTSIHLPWELKKPRLAQ